jgi:lipoprotein-anchoring transpeptidase ErfK/SrfK
MTRQQPFPQPYYAPPSRPPRPKRTNWTPIIVFGGLMAAAVAFVGLLGFLALFMRPGAETARVPDGIQIAGVNVGGQTQTNITQYLAQNPVPASFTLLDGSRQWSLTPAELGVRVNPEATLYALENAVPGMNVPLSYSIDLNQTQAALINLSTQTNIAAVSGSSPQNGRALDIPTVLDRLYSNGDAELADGTIELAMLVTEPEVTTRTARNPNGETTTHVVEAGQELGLIAREYGVTVEDVMAMNDISNPDLLYVGQELIIPAAGIYEPTAAEAPAAPTNTGKSIVVSTGQQRIYAYENGQMVHSHLASTGLPDTPTVLGNYSVYVKYTATDMSGPGYFLPQVPFTMYFYQGYGIHGTYWHNNFGRPMSHGCVNLPTEEAQWFFNWAEVGTPVQVI